MASFDESHVGQEVVIRGEENEERGIVKAVRDGEVNVALDNRHVGDWFNQDDVELAGQTKKAASSAKVSLADLREEDVANLGVSEEQFNKLSAKKQIELLNSKGIEVPEQQ